MLVIGAGPAGLEFARVASGQGNSVIVYEREQPSAGTFALMALYLIGSNTEA